MTRDEHETRLKRVTQLRDCPGWADYLRPRIAARLASIEREVLTNESLTADRVMLLRAEAKGLRDVLAMPDVDEKVSAATVKQGPGL